MELKKYGIEENKRKTLKMEMNTTMLNWVFSKVEDRTEHLYKICTSACYFALTFIAVTYTGHACSSIMAWHLGYTPHFSIAGMDVLAHTRGWTATKVAMVYLAPPIWGLFVSITAILMGRFVHVTNTRLKTILFWLSINGFLLYIAYIITGLLCGNIYTSKFFTGFVCYYSWLDWPEKTVNGILAVQGLASLPYCFLFTKSVHSLNYSKKLVESKSGQSIMLTNVVLIPFLIGSVLVAISSFPLDMEYQLVRILCFLPVFALIRYSLNFFQVRQLQIIRGGLRAHPKSALILLSLMLFFAVRFILTYKIDRFW